MQAGKQAGNLFHRCHAERKAPALATVPGLAQIGAFAAFQAEVVQGHDRFLAQLDQAQAQVEIGLPVGLAHLVEHRAQAEPVSFLAEAPYQRARHIRRADRIAHRDQRTAVALHHHKALFRIIAQHRLVGGQYQAGLGIGGTGQYRRQ